jgi:putative acetyltransferase
MEFYIRPVESGDACGINFLRAMPGVCENILALPSERAVSSDEYINGLRENDHAFAAVKKDGGEVIGMACLNVYSHPRTRHMGDFTIMVHAAYQGRGVGTALLEAIINLADNWLILERIGLFVLTDNYAAIKLYEKFGFKIEGTERRSIIRNGKYADAHLMGRIRSELKRN